jgi:hypothetical protein
VDEACEEGEITIDQKSFGAKQSKFQTSPNKKKNKIIIVDEEEEKQFGMNTSINNHASIGTILQNQKISMFGGLDASLSPCKIHFDREDRGLNIELLMSNKQNNIIQEEDDDDPGLDTQKKASGGSHIVLNKVKFSKNKIEQNDNPDHSYDDV